MSEKKKKHISGLWIGKAEPDADTSADTPTNYFKVLYIYRFKLLVEFNDINWRHIFRCKSFWNRLR